MELYGLILDMRENGYDPESIMATVESRLAEEVRRMDDYWTAVAAERERADRDRLAALVGTVLDPFC